MAELVNNEYLDSVLSRLHTEFGVIITKINARCILCTHNPTPDVSDFQKELLIRVWQEAGHVYPIENSILDEEHDWSNLKDYKIGDIVLWPDPDDEENTNPKFFICVVSHTHDNVPPSKRNPNWKQIT